ncbi:MAG: integrase core domain-containing protein [Segetibacter sp.]
MFLGICKYPHKRKIATSITQSGRRYKNALAKRVNGKVKNDIILKRVYQNHKDARKAINQKRPHARVVYLTPDEAHLNEGNLKIRWKQ